MMSMSFKLLDSWDVGRLLVTYRINIVADICERRFELSNKPIFWDFFTAISIKSIRETEKEEYLSLYYTILIGECV